MLHTIKFLFLKRLIVKYLSNKMFLKNFFKFNIINFVFFITLTILLFLITKFFLSTEFKKFYLNLNFYFFIFFIIVFLIKIIDHSKLTDYFLIFIFSIGISLYIAETFLHFNPSSKMTDIEIRNKAAQKLGLNFDKRTKFQVYQYLKSKGEDVVPTIPPNDYFINYNEFFNEKNEFAISGVSNKKTVFCNEGGKMITYKSDRYGFRNKDSLWNKKNIEWVILGDSLIHGACVGEGAGIHERIIFYTNENLLNLGYQGHGPLMQLAALKEYGEIKKPKNIIWFYSEANDLDNIIYEMKQKKLKKYLSDNNNYTQNLINKQDLIDKQHTGLIEIIYKNSAYDSQTRQMISNNGIFFKIKAIVKLYKLREFISFFLPREFALVRKQFTTLNVFDAYQQVLQEASNLVKNWGGNIYFIYYPHASRFHDSGFKTYSMTQKNKMINIAENVGVKIIDLQNAFDEVNDKKSLYPLRIFGHPNEKGYDMVANFIVKKVNKID